MCFHIIKYVYSFQRTHISVPHFVGVFVYAGTINRTPTAACGLPLRCERIAKTLRTDCDNILNKLQQHNIQKTKTILLQCKNHLFARQKPYFCNAKTILLQRKNHTFAWRICNTQITNTLRTLRECILNALRMRGEYVYAGTINRTPTAANGLPKCGERIAIMQRTPTKHPANTPQKTYFWFS